jgi:hypothetical protein
MAVIEERLTELGIRLPPVFPPAGNYLACVVDGDMVFVGGHGPSDGERLVRGEVGRDLTVEEGRDAAPSASPSSRSTSPSRSS